MLEKQELHCHNCNNYVQFDIDIEMNGNHVIVCPSCGHEHCRVVENGIITSDRWDSRNSFDTIANYATNITYTANSTFTYYTNTSTSFTDSTNNFTGNSIRYFTYQSWMNTTNSSNGQPYIVNITAV